MEGKVDQLLLLLEKLESFSLLNTAAECKAVH